MKVHLAGKAAWLAVIIAIAIPGLEMVGIYQVAQRIGWGYTLLWLAAAVWAGMTLIRAQHSDLPARVMQAIARGETPLGEIWASGRRLMAGVFLILPGAGSDVLALLLLLWPTARRPLPRPTPHDDVIEGEFRRED